VRVGPKLTVVTVGKLVAIAKLMAGYSMLTVMRVKRVVAVVVGLTVVVFWACRNVSGILCKGVA
jgi:hypothetical protein